MFHADMLLTHLTLLNTMHTDELSQATSHPVFGLQAACTSFVCIAKCTTRISQGIAWSPGGAYDRNSRPACRCHQAPNNAPNQQPLAAEHAGSAC